MSDPIKMSAWPEETSPELTDYFGGFKSPGGEGTSRRFQLGNIATILATVLQAKDDDLDAIAALATTTFGRALLTLADAAALRTAGGLGSAAQLDGDTDISLAANSDSRVATQKAVKAYVDALVGGAPGALDTLNELAAALGDDANYAATVTAALAGKLAIANALSELTASAATARSNIGLGTSDSPQFAGVNLGHSSDTTITRVAPGKIAVEGVVTIRESEMLHICNGRLTTEAGVADSASDRTSQGTLRFTPYKGNGLALYDGTTWRLFTFAEFALTLTLTSGKNYDVFPFASTAAPSATNTGTDIITFGSAQGWATGSYVTVDATGGGLTAGTGYWWNAASSTTGSFHATLADALAGTNKVDLTANITANVTGISLELSAAWTNDTTRADALAAQNGVTVKSGTATRRWVGTIRASGTNVTEDSLQKRFVWNAYNQITRRHYVTSSSSHTYDSATVQQWNASSANQCEFVVGDTTRVRTSIAGQVTAGTAGTLGGAQLMVNTSISTQAAEGKYVQVAGTGAAGSGYWSYTQATGYAVLYALERGTGAATNTWPMFAISGDFLC